ncbi:GtrA family protein [Aliivibrio salmonicida]|jgi:putative flippase GtrA|uniref:GtrA family protein n=1 Tax=Aliivibrio TaxID=511678 RepID=UPI00080DB5EF|nr:GtrA family protein [Aliivibrio sp. 1S128]OCH14460.1 hypothetical protein A6E03_17000 [Aliivibrio sp. 1S128]
MIKLIKFACVGGVGFVVDSTVFMLCFHLFDAPIAESRVIAFFFAATTTWLGNHWFTFGSTHNTAFTLLKEWQKSMLSACISAIPNFIIFMSVVSVLGKETVFLYSGLLLGVIGGMLSNYWFNLKWVFNK